MNQNLAPSFEDLNSSVVDVPHAIGEVAVLAYGESTADPSSDVTPIGFDSFL